MGSPLARAGARIVAGLGLAVGLLTTAAAAERTRLTIYTALEEEQIGWIGEALARAVPEVEAVWVRGSTGTITDRLRDEKDAPQADVAFGIGASSLMLLKKADLLAEYRPDGAARLRPFFLDPEPPYTWTGMDAYLGAVCFNAGVAAELGAMRPVLWRELLAPAFKGRIAMPDPTRSGTGFLLVAGWLQSMGEAAAWTFMDALNENIAVYLPSGSAPCYGAVRGDYAAGLSFDMRGATERAKGAPIDIIVPIDGVGWEQEAVAIMKTTPRSDLARKVVDWAASKEASEIYARSFAIVAYPGVTNPSSSYPPHAEARMIKVDLGWEADHRQRILAEWNRRYAAKARPQ